MTRTAPTLAAAILALGTLAAQATDDNLLNFDGMSEDDRAAAAEAHEALHEAEARMCAVMVRLYSEHVARVDDAELKPESVGYLERRCEAEAFADHVAQSIRMHDLIHDYAHRHDNGHSHD